MQTAQFQPTSFRIDPKIKQSAVLAAHKLNISLNTVVNAMLKGFAKKPQLLLTENGFTPIFEAKVLNARKGKYTEYDSSTDFLDALKKRQKKSA
jgi:antitoxin component of RelBE/YafQ-DinJ toxin-antitoxin module